jgi:hypothetical protein
MRIETLRPQGVAFVGGARCAGNARIIIFAGARKMQRAIAHAEYE